MPVLDNALVAAGLIFLPILVALRVGKPVLRGVAALTNRIPRSNYLVDIVLDWTRRPPRPPRRCSRACSSGAPRRRARSAS